MTKMQLSYKAPAAQKVAKEHMCRCLAVMLCCVLVFGLTVPAEPKVKAVVAEVGLAGVSAGGSVAAGGLAVAPVAAVVGLLALGACGVSFASGYFQAGPDNVFYGTQGYDLGYNCMEYLKSLGGDLYDWYSETVSKYEAAGGVKPGDTLTIPPEVAAAVKAWAIDHIDFTDGEAVYTQRGIFTDSGQVIFTVCPTGYSYDKVPASAVALGTVIPYGATSSFTFTDVDGATCEIRYSLGYDGAFLNDMFYIFVRDGDVVYHVDCGKNALFLYLRELDGRYFLCGDCICYLSGNNSGYLQFTAEYWKSSSILAGRYPCISVENLTSLSTSVAATPELEEEKTQDLVVTVPGEIPTQQVGGYEIPVLGDVSADVLTPSLDVPGTDVDTPAVPGISAGEITDAIADALPVTGAVAGDAVVDEALTEPDSLGAVFVSKFPFSIPWDIVKAIQLLAAPPAVPRFEIDLLAPIKGHWGFHPRGSTTIVLDYSQVEFGAQVIRWLSTVLFIYALAASTKRFIWTA